MKYGPKSHHEPSVALRRTEYGNALRKREARKIADPQKRRAVHAARRRLAARDTRWLAYVRRVL